MTHIMWLTNLAPEIQEAILSLLRVESEPDTVKEIDVRRIARVMDWGVPRGRWESLFGSIAFSWHGLLSLAIRTTGRKPTPRVGSAKGLGQF